MEQWNTIVKGCVVNGVATLGCLPAVLVNIVNALLGLSGVVALFLIIFSGIKLITSGGEAKKIDEGRKTLTSALLGLILVLISFLIINIISGITGVGCINQFGFTNCNPQASIQISTPSSTPNAGGGGGGGGGGSW